MREAKEIIPACVRCQTKIYVVRDRTAEKIGTVSGGIIGAAAAYIAAQAEESESVVVLGIKVAVFAAMLVGCLSGSATGNMLGERIDCKIRMKYRCLRCGAVIYG